jgi:hypothetical protein
LFQGEVKQRPTLPKGKEGRQGARARMPTETAEAVKNSTIPSATKKFFKENRKTP